MSHPKQLLLYPYQCHILASGRVHEKVHTTLAALKVASLLSEQLLLWTPASPSRKLGSQPQALHDTALSNSSTSNLSNVSYAANTSFSVPHDGVQATSIARHSAQQQLNIQHQNPHHLIPGTSSTCWQSMLLAMHPHPQSMLPILMYHNSMQQCDPYVARHQYSQRLCA